MRWWRKVLLVSILCVPAGCGTFDTAAYDADAGEGTNAKDGVDAGADSASGGGDASEGASTATNFAALGYATATSVHPDDKEGTYPPSHLIDGKKSTSWYAAPDSCQLPNGGAEYVCVAPQPSIDIKLDLLRTIGRVKVFGNRGDYASDWDVLKLRLELLDDAANVLYTAEKATSRGAEPNGDVDIVITPARTNVRTVRVVVLTGEQDDPGLAEIEAYAN